MICPNCGNQQFRESRQCPKHGGEPVCIRCCHECHYYNPEPVALKCRWHLSHQKPDYRAEIEKLSRQIRTKERQVEHFYRENKPWIAKKIEGELSWLRHDRMQLERKMKDENA